MHFGILPLHYLGFNISHYTFGQQGVGSVLVHLARNLMHTLSSLLDPCHIRVWPIRQPATRERARCFGFAVGELSVQRKGPRDTHKIYRHRNRRENFTADLSKYFFFTCKTHFFKYIQYFKHPFIFLLHLISIFESVITIRKKLMNIQCVLSLS